MSSDVHPGKINMGSSSPVCSHVYENELVTYIREMENAMYGRTVTGLP